MPHCLDVLLKKKQYLKIQKFQHKGLKVVYNSKRNYDELLWGDNEILIHRRQVL